MTQAGALLQNLVAARRYTAALLDEMDPHDWFRMPNPSVTHVAWQVGHLAMAEYRLALERVRGVREGDEQILPAHYMTLFGRGSQPSSDASEYPTANELRATFDRVHACAVEELYELADSDLTLPLHTPHRIATNRYEVLQWCAQHEMLHAGQIGLLRRLLGAPPVW